MRRPESIALENNDYVLKYFFQENPSSILVTTITTLGINPV
jgi:hypothetical protein